MCIRDRFYAVRYDFRYSMYVYKVYTLFVKNIFNLKQIIQKRREINLETHLAFKDYEKAFDRICRNRLGSIIKKDDSPEVL